MNILKSKKHLNSPNFYKLCNVAHFKMLHNLYVNITYLCYIDIKDYIFKLPTH